MAVKLLKRVRRRHRYEILKGLKSTFMSKLYRWCFLTQWRATLLASTRQLSVIWIGRGFNPDYTQNCIGICTFDYCPNYGNDCAGSVDCQILSPTCTDMGTCDCPTPLANSHEVGNSCTCQASGYKCTACAYPLLVCNNRTYSCPCAGTCAFDCDTGYSWNGSQCVLITAKAPVMDGLVYAD